MGNEKVLLKSLASAKLFFYIHFIFAFFMVQFISIEGLAGKVMREIHFYSNLYLGEGMEAMDLEEIKQDLLTNPLLADVYLITRSLNQSDQLDIYHSKYLIQKFYADHPPFIYGIAKDKGSAISMVEKIVQECVAARGDADLIAYLGRE